MKGKIIGIGIIAVIVIAALVMFTYTGDGLWKETNNVGNGEWGQEIVLTFADGSTQSLKILQDGQNNPFSIKSGGTTITSITYNLKASATGDFTTAQIQSKAGAEFHMWTAVHGSTTWTIVDTVSPVSILQTINVNGQLQNIYTNTWTTAFVEPQVPAGEFDLKFMFSNNFEYKGNGQTSWTTFPAPAALIITLTKTQSLSIVWNAVAP